ARQARTRAGLSRCRGFRSTLAGRTSTTGRFPDVLRLARSPGGRGSSPEEELPPCPPQIDDEHVGTHEEEHEALDHQRQIRRKLRLEDARVEVAGGGSVDECTEEQRGKEDSNGGVSSEECDRDANEADRRALDVVYANPELPAEHVDRSREARRRPGDRHREEVVLRDTDARVASGLRVEADGTYLETECRAVEDDPVGDEGRDGDEESNVQALQDRAPPEDVEMRVR